MKHFIRGLPKDRIDVLVDELAARLELGRAAYDEYRRRRAAILGPDTPGDVQALEAAYQAATAGFGFVIGDVGALNAVDVADAKQRARGHVLDPRQHPEAVAAAARAAGEALHPRPVAQPEQAAASRDPGFYASESAKVAGVSRDLLLAQGFAEKPDKPGLWMKPLGDKGVNLYLDTRHPHHEVGWFYAFAQGKGDAWPEDKVDALEEVRLFRAAQDPNQRTLDGGKVAEAARPPVQSPGPAGAPPPSAPAPPASAAAAPTAPTASSASPPAASAGGPPAPVEPQPAQARPPAAVHVPRLAKGQKGRRIVAAAVPKSWEGWMRGMGLEPIVGDPDRAGFWTLDTTEEHATEVMRRLRERRVQYEQNPVVAP